MLVALSCRAQDLRYFSGQSWSTEEGLPQNSIHALAQTRDGYLWIATEAGLSRYNGSSFKVFDTKTDSAFRSNDICCLVQLSGDLWVGTSDGLVRMHDGQFVRYAEPAGLPAHAILSLHASRESLLIETTSGWAGWNGQRIQPVTAPPDATDWSNKQGTHWQWAPQSVTISTHGNSHTWHTGIELPKGRISTVLVDREGVAWIGMNNGLFIANPITATVMPVPALHRSSILSIFEDAEGSHWIGTETSGLHVLRQLTFRSEAALTGTAVTGVTQTTDHEVWVGTRDDGLRRLRDGVLDQPFSDVTFTSAVTLCLSPAIGNGLWVGTPDGLNYVAIDSSKQGTPHVQRITSADGLPDDYIRSLAASGDGSVWVGTPHGLAHLQKEGGKFKAVNLSSADGLGGDLIGALLLTSNATHDLWASTSGGLSLVRSDGRITNFTTKNGLPSLIATALTQDREGTIWVATDDGSLSLFDGKRFVMVMKPDSSRGSDNKIQSIIADGSGALWLRMERGIRRISALSLKACIRDQQCPLKDDAIVTFGLADGLPNDEIVAGASSAALLASNGELWFPSRGGVAVVDTLRLPINSFMPPVTVERFLVDDVPQPASDSPLEIPFAHSRLTMEYAALSFVAPSEIRYRFMLEGFDHHWTEAGNRRAATYTNLPPGTYTFRVQAMNNDGLWNRVGATLAFRVVPPFYRRWWFITLAVFVFFLALAGLYLLRLRRLRGQFNAVLAERNRMAREIHDTLTQDFVGTSLQLDILSQQLKSGHVEKAIDQVRQTRQLVTDGLEEARRSIWELRANNSQDSLPTRMNRLLQRDTYTGIAPKFHIGGAYRELDARIEREILRITQEALSNIQRHANATDTLVNLLYAADGLTLSVRDNGVGFSLDEAARKEGHYGLVGMRERAFAIDGKLDIVSQSGSGTTVTLNVPLAGSMR
jgi:signal transduction histidine kinase/ligand-binding sensor domain-containing protein